MRYNAGLELLELLDGTRGFGSQSYAQFNAHCAGINCRSCTARPDDGKPEAKVAHRGMISSIPSPRLAGIFRVQFPVGVAGRVPALCLI